MEIYNIVLDKNTNQPYKIAMSMTMSDGTTRSCTYGQLFSDVTSYSDKLSSYGVRRGDRVIISADNSIEWVISFLAIMKLQATAVLIDSSLNGSDLLQLAKRSQAQAFYLNQKVKDKLEGAYELSIPLIDLSNNGLLFDGSVEYAPAISSSSSETDIAAIIYSSGTTKAASGIMHSHDALIGSVRMTIAENNLTENDRVLSVLPCSHIYGLITNLLGPLIMGGTVNYLESLNNANVLLALKNFKPTAFPCVPKVLELFETQISSKIKQSPLTKTVFNSLFPICVFLRSKFGINLGPTVFKSIHKGFGGNLKVITSAGAPLSEDVARFYYGVGFDILITYGLTETNVPIVGNREKNITCNTCGTPYPNVSIKIDNANEHGEGEILVKSPYMMKGYFLDDEATNEAFKDGWFKTGDLGHLDKNGLLHITGRSKENIVLANGKKIAPTDIEHHYSSIDGVQELVISGVPQNANYDEVHAFVVKHSLYEESKVLKAIQEKGSRLSQYMKITKVHFLEEIPKTSLQKPKRFLLKKYALENGSTQESEDTTYNEYIDTDIETVIKHVVQSSSGADWALIHSDARLIRDIGIDSITTIEIACILEEKYKFSMDSLIGEDLPIKELASKIAEKLDLSTEKDTIRPSFKIFKKGNIHYHIFKFFTGLSNLLYRINIRGTENLPENGGYIICANHVSNIDLLFVANRFNKSQFMKLYCLAKKELFKDTFFSKLLIKTCGMIPVDRSGVNSSTLNLCEKHLKNNYALLIHPEGTRSKTGELGTLKTGAATLALSSNVPIIPVYIKGAFEIFPPDRKLPRLFRLKGKYPVEVCFGEPLQTNDKTAEELTSELAHSIQTLKDSLE